MLRKFLIGVVTLSSSACVADAPSSTDLGSIPQGVTWIGGCRMVGLYQANAGQAWNDRNVTVADYRQCASPDPTDNHHNAASVARFLNATAPGSTLVPGFDPDGVEGAYRVFAPLSKENHKLLIYLPGSGSSTGDKEQLLQRAAYLGYHVIALRYWNDDDGGTGRCGDGPEQHGPDKGKFVKPHTSCKYGVACNPYTDVTPVTYDDCAIRFYTSVFDNGDPGFTPAHVAPFHNQFSVAPPMFCGLGMMKDGTGWDSDTCEGVGIGPSLTKGDAVLYRVRKLLTFLEAVHSEDGWGQFKAPGKATYDDGALLDWENVTLMGHSTGSKVLFHTAHDRKVGRAIFLSGPNLGETRAGTDVTKYLDSYTDTAAKTPLENLYAFSATHDPNFYRAEAIWTYMAGTLAGKAHTGLIGGPPAEAAETMQPIDCTGPNRFNPDGTVKKCELAPRVPAGNPRALRYSGNVACYVNQTSCGEHTFPNAHPSTTSDQYSCPSLDPRECWYVHIWDYLLVGNP